MALSEAQYWELQATEYSRTSLTRIRAVATAWAATISTLIGLFGVVAVVTGPKAIDDFGDGVQLFLLMIIGGAFVAAFLAVSWTALAAQGVPKRFRPVTGLKLLSWTREETQKASNRLQKGRVAALIAGGLIGVAGITAMAATALAPGAGVNALIKTRDGQIQCGQLKRGTDGSLTAVFVGGSLVLRSGIEDATVVDGCP
jgi:hypothetical protein